MNQPTPDSVSRRRWDGAAGLMPRRRVAAIGNVPDAITRLRTRIEPAHEFIAFLRGSDLLQYLETTRPEVVVFLGGVDDYPLPDLLAELQARTQGWDRPLSVIFVGPSEMLAATSPASDELIVYRCAWNDEALAFATIVCLVEHHGCHHALPVGPSRDAKSAPVVMAAGKVAEQMESESLRKSIEQSAAGLMQAERAYCLFFDGDEGLLWREGCEREGERFTGSEGLAALAARTGQTFLAPLATHDLRYVRHRDDPMDRVAGDFE